MRQVRAAAQAGSAAAQLAIDVHPHRLRREIAAMAAAMGGLDALVFTAIGEHQSAVRAQAAAGLASSAWRSDPACNTDATGDTDFSTTPASVRTLVIAAREDIEIARQVRAELGLGSHRAGEAGS